MNSAFIDLLQKRSTMLAKVRAFFAKRHFLEVDCPILSSYPSLDENIEVMQVQGLPLRYLHTSPEYAMKRLLAEGVEAIYQMGPVFRKEEIGPLHNPEFTLVEWYHKNMSFSFFLQEIRDFFSLFLGKNLLLKKMTYRQVFLHFAKIDYLFATKKDCQKILSQKGMNFSEGKNEDLSFYLDLILTHLIEPHLGKGCLFMIYDYPPDRAALAKLKQKKDELVAERFEFYYQGIELANGYHELSDAQEQKHRFIQASQKKHNLPINEKLLKALEKGIGNCFGIAAGFDRLLMLALEKKTIQEVLPFSWDNV